MCFGGGGAPSAPNVTQQANASSGIGQTAQNNASSQLGWAQQGVAGQQGQTANAQSTLNGQASGAFGAGNAAQDQFQNQTLGGLNQQLGTAQNWGSPQGVQQAQANAAATTGQSFDAARMNNQRQLAAYGVDPSQLKSSFSNLQGNLAQAGATGNAVYNAGQNRQLQSMGMVSNALGQNLGAAGVGQGYSSQGANMTGQGVQLGNQTLATGSQALTAPSQWSQVGLQGQGQSANILNQQFQNQLASYQAQSAGENALMGGLGQIGGMAAMAMMADGGDINVPTIPLGGVQPVQIQQGAQFSQPQGGFGQGLAQGAQREMQRALPPRSLPPRSRAAPGTPTVGGPEPNPQMQDSNGSPMMNARNGGGVPPRKRAQFPPSGQAQNPGQRAQPGMGDAGPMTFADGGFANVNPNALREPGVPQPRPMHTPPMHMAAVHADPPHMPQQQRLHYGQLQGGHADGGLPGATWSMGSVADGGHPPGMIQNGPSDGTGIDDQVHAKVSVGEYIVPADVVHAKGKEFFDKLLQRYHTPAEQQRQQMGIPQRRAA